VHARGEPQPPTSSPRVRRARASRPPMRAGAWRGSPGPLHGVEPAHVVLATRAKDRSRLVAAFRKLARTFLKASGS
jgi:hypothetical protein